MLVCLTLAGSCGIEQSIVTQQAPTPASSPRIRYLGWNKPTIELVADALLQLRDDAPLDFPRATVVVPTMESGRRLNNFVTEVVNAPLTNGTYSVPMPDEGWVWISLSAGDEDTEASFDLSGVPVVHFRRGEPFETMRYLGCGPHVLTVSGAPAGGRIRVHAVKRIVHCQPHGDAKPSTPDSIGFDFYRDRFARFYNTVAAYQIRARGDGRPEDYALNGWLLERGIDLGDELPAKLPEMRLSKMQEKLARVENRVAIDTAKIAGTDEQAILAKHPEYAEQFEPMPFNSGYFMCVRPKGVDAEAVRRRLIERHSTGVIVLSGLVRLAFSTVPLAQLPRLFANVNAAIAELKGGR